MSADLPPDAAKAASDPPPQNPEQQAPDAAPPTGPPGGQATPGGRRFGPPRPGGPGPRGPREARPRTDGTKPPPLDRKDFGAFKPNKRDLDKSIEDELNAAMAGAGDLKGSLEAPQPKPDAPAVPG